MCGIVGYIGPKDGKEVVLKGLQRLEYRGYDSAGIAMMTIDPTGINRQVDVLQAVGEVSQLIDKVNYRLPYFEGETITTTIGHTRWATHGAPEERNAHPHVSNSKVITLVHNGIIENYETLKKQLINNGYFFYSDTDTEVLANWIDYIYHNIYSERPEDFQDAVRFALKDVVGAYAILVLDTHNPETMIMARKSSPMAIGLIGQDECIVASDATPIVEYTKDIIYIEDNQIAVIERKDGALQFKIIDMENQPIDPIVERVELELDQIEKGGYDSFMLKEIHEQPESVWNGLRGRLTEADEPLMLGGVEDVLPQLLRANKIFIIACGTSWHAALIGKNMIEKLTRIPVEVDYASEFRYKDPIIRPGDVVIAISQSGETADTKAAMEMARERGATLFGIVNSVGSSIARLADAGIYTHSGVEIGVASTKAFTGQVAALALLSIKMARQLNSITDNDYIKLKTALKHIPGKIKSILDDSNHIFEVANKYAADEYQDFLYLARGINFPVALEGSLKLKEISYIHAEGYPAGEMKHGPIALIDEQCPSIFIVPNDSSYGKVVSNMQEVKARKGPVIAIVTKGDELISGIADEVIEIPETEELLSPLLTVIPLQLLSYRIAVQRGCNVDKPRNLAKSVTVE